MMDAVRRLVKLGVVPHGMLFRDRRRGLVILVYHRIGGGTGSPIDVPADAFARQMAYLRDRYTMVSLDAVLDGTVPGGGPPAASDLVAVTFDDGHREVYEYAFPVLLKYRIPATIYLATRYVEAQRAFDFGDYAAGGGRPQPLTWPQVRDMAASRLIQFGGHTHSHVDLTRLSLKAVRDEVDCNRRVIEERTGMAPRHFAYPWGRLTPSVKGIVGESFATAVRGGCRKNPYGHLDALALWRTPIQQSDGFWFFRLKLGSYLDGEEFFRTLAGRMRNGAPQRDGNR
ncbi:MAG: polysaccharide deacetylase family protein [bacterium]